MISGKIILICGTFFIISANYLSYGVHRFNSRWTIELNIGSFFSVGYTGGHLWTLWLSFVSFLLLLSCRFLALSNLNFQEELIYYNYRLAEVRVKTVKQFDYTARVYDPVKYGFKFWSAAGSQCKAGQLTQDLHLILAISLEAPVVRPQSKLQSCVALKASEGIWEFQ